MAGYGGSFGNYMTGYGSGTPSNPMQGYTQQGSNFLGDYGTHLGTAIGINNPASKSAYGSLQSSVGTQQAAEQGILGNMAQAGQGYAQNMQGMVSQNQGLTNQLTSNYENALQQSKDNLTDQATNSKTAYTNTVLPGLQNVMTQEQGNAGQAMTLGQMQDPNNAVATGTRNMYNTQAQGIQNQGLADYGVLAALGGQATANTIGGAGQPVTGGQMQALQGANLGQASSAFGNAQNTANQLKVQGIQAGQQQSNLAYGAGQQAIQDYSQGVQNYGAANNQMNAIQNQYTQQQQGVASDLYGTGMGQANQSFNQNAGLAGLNYGIQNQGYQNQLAAQNQQFGSQQAFDVANMNAANAAAAGKLGFGGGQIGNAVGYFEGGGPMNYMGGAGGGGGGGQGGGAASGAVGTSQAFAGQYQGLGSYPQAPQGQPGAYGGAGYQPGAYGGYPGAGTYGNAGAGGYGQPQQPGPYRPAGY